MSDKLEVLGRVEMADLLQVDTRTPHAWHTRRLLPPPDHASVNGGPAWNRSTILEWAAKTGRLPEDLRFEWDPDGHFATPSRPGGRVAKKRFGTDATSQEGSA